MEVAQVANDRMNQGSSQGQQGSGDKPSYDKSDPKWDDKTKGTSPTGQGSQTDMNRGSQSGQGTYGQTGQTGQPGQPGQTGQPTYGSKTGQTGQPTYGSKTGQGSQTQDRDDKSKSDPQTGQDKGGGSNR